MGIRFSQQEKSINKCDSRNKNSYLVLMGKIKYYSGRIIKFSSLVIEIYNYIRI